VGISVVAEEANYSTTFSPESGKDYAVTTHAFDFVISAVLRTTGKTKGWTKDRVWESNVSKCFETKLSADAKYKGKSQALRAGLAAGTVAAGIPALIRNLGRLLSPVGAPALGRATM